MVAAGLVYHRDQDADRLAGGDLRLQENVAVGLLNVAIEVGDDSPVTRCHVRQVRGNGGFAGAALPACDSNSHFASFENSSGNTMSLVQQGTQTARNRKTATKMILAASTCVPTAIVM